MTVEQLKQRVICELDSRSLADPSRRKRALEHVVEFLNKGSYIKDGAVMLPSDRALFKAAYSAYKSSSLSGAESSVINELYNQYGR